MTRSGFKKMWLLVVAVMFGSSMYIYNKGVEYRNKISRAEMERDRLTFDLNTGNKLSATLESLDNSTMDETDNTRLDVLRYLSLETSDMKYRALSKSEQVLGGATLYTRRFSIAGKMSYVDSLDQADWLYNTNKITLNKVDLKPGKGSGDIVDFSVEGTIYGLFKN